MTLWFRGHRTLASVVTLSLIVGVPLTFAAINPGYPVTSVQLTARDVWVTKSSAELAGRMNTQVGQLDSSVSTVSHDFDVLQDGETVLLADSTSGVMRQVDPSLVRTSSATTTTLPSGADVELDGGVLAVESAAGKLWRVPVADGSPVNFDYQSTPSADVHLGAGAQVSVERDGTVDAATTTGTLYQLDASTGAVRSSPIPRLTNFQLSSVGNVPVILDLSHHRLIEGNGSTYSTPGALALQQPGDAASYALMSTSTGLLRMDLANGTATKVPVKGAAGSGKLPQPVHMGDCDNGVWSATAVAVYACPGATPRVNSLGSGLAGDSFAFRVNQLSVALNDLTNGYSWLTGSATAIHNWGSVPPQQQSPTTGKNNGKNITYVQTPPTFHPDNHAPTAVDDAFGVRAGGTTPLPVLKNDTDPDGDVLTVTKIGGTPSDFGEVQLGAGGQSPQFTPTSGARGSQTVSYSISDGRGGTSSASVKITIVPDDVDNPPKSGLAATLLVEQGQTVTYNVLDDWVDPDGDAMQVTAATVASGDTVRFTPDGYITFRSSSETGVKTVTYTVQDSSSAQKTATGKLTVDVKAAGSTAPLAESDFASGVVGNGITVSPLLNDKAPSGQPLHLQTIKQVVGTGPAPTINADKGTVQFSENQAGSYEFEYTETAGTNAKSSNAFIRLDVADPPTTHAPPVAVSDVAYLTYPGSVTVPVLDNDTSPEGLVLGVQSISPPALSGFTAQLLSNTTIKITATGTSIGDKPVVVPYTISDGTSSATASVTVVAVSQLVNHQAPITADDVVTVRAGEVATASVLDADVDPDGAAMSLNQKLVQGPTAGLAFVTGNDVRYQAPSTPGQYSAVYTVVDTGGESSTGRVLFTVTPATSKGNRAPQPAAVVSRVFAGGTVRVQVPLAGIDPDGDTALLESIPQNPQLGKITNVTSTYFDYQAGTGSTGTDTFNYEVTDQFGATATAGVSIGVIPRAGLGLPTAVDDSATLKPNTHATVNVLANDSDPNGYAITIVPKSLKNLGTKSISASIVGNDVVLHSGGSVGDYSVQYSISDGHANPATAIIHVKVSKTAVDLPPIAVDHVLQLKDVASGKPVKVAARSGASDPSGVVSELAVSLSGKASPTSRVTGGNVFVTPGKKASTVAYTLTDPRTKLTSTAFILVPAIPPAGWNLAPYIRKDLKQQVVQIGTATKFALADIVTVPHGGTLPAVLLDKQQLSATHGKVKYTDAGDFTYTPDKGYSGPAAITFNVGDSAHPAHTAVLTLPVVVGDPDGKDLKPTFTTIHTQAAQNATTPISLINATGNSKWVTYSVKGGNALVKGSTAGPQNGTLNVEVAKNAKEGSSVTFHVTLTTPSPSSYTVTGQVVVKIVKTTAPLAQAISDSAHIKRGVTTTIDALANDVNPFPGTPLKIVKVSIDNSGEGAKPSTNGTTVTFTPDASFIGNVSLHYTVEDATDDADRQVTGEILVTVWDVPDAPAAPTASSVGDGRATFTFNTPDTDNGSAITSYIVRSSPASDAPSCTAGAPCTFTGLQNGTAYTFYVSATNSVGTGAESSGLTMIPYGTPSNISASATDGPDAGQVTVSWTATANVGGGTPNYEWRQNPSGGWNPAGSNSFSAVVNIGAGNSATFDVRVCNTGGNCSTDATTNLATAPSPPPTLSISKGSTPPSSVCTDPNCRFVDVTGTNFPANTQITVSYNTDHGGNGQFTTGTYTTNGSGSFSASDVYFSFTTYHVWVTVGSVASNTITW
ncbi:MAG TPA: Ig-like domain-containing protein [Galbitalea sp.]|nr:Ig-like domain-containing protein [Galbitalea sp.]